MDQSNSKHYDMESMENETQVLLPPITEIKEQSKSWKNVVAFWIFGLTNNFGYVVMLSAAFDILAKQEGKEKKKYTEGFHCNPHSTGVILLADILPTLFIKWTAPWYMQALGYHLRVFVVVFLSIASFITVAFSTSIPISVLGVVLASLGSGFGEPTFLSLSSQYSKNCVSAWSSGTGAAGLAGALSYAGLLSIGVTSKNSLLIMNVSPLLMVIGFWVFLEPPDASSSRGNTCKYLIWRGKGKDKTSKRSFLERCLLVKPLLKYMIPLFFVYLGEYTINQGLYELLYYPNIFLNQAEQYRWFQADYQLGVLISRSSVNIIQCKHLEVLASLQYVNFIILLLEVYFRFIPTIWITFGIIFFEGLLGGSVYVNAFYRIASEVSEENKEFSMGIASTGDATGISLAAFLSMPLHSSLCNYSKRL